MMFSRNPNGGVVPGAAPAGVQPAQDPRAGLALQQLQQRLVALEQDHAKLAQAFRALVQKLAQRAQAAQQQVTPTGARVPQVVVEQGPQDPQASQARDFDQEIEDAIEADGGDDDDPFAGV
jgi:hypothetical protein